MAGSNGQPPLPVQSIDWVFSQLPGAHPEELPPAPDLLPRDPLEVAETPAIVLPQPPPGLDHSPDFRAAYEWLQAEKERLEEYTRKHFVQIKQHHHELMLKHFRAEEAMALRTQEVNRNIKLVDGQAKALQERARQLTEREAAVAAQAEPLARAREELLTLQQTSADLQEQMEIQRARLEELRAETARLQQARRLSREEAATWEVALAKKEAELTVRQDQMERRYQALEQAEEATRRRTAELDELEYRLGQEFERQERQLAKDRRDLERQRAQLRVQGLLPERNPRAETISLGD